MRILHVRRHAYTKKGEARGRGSHLSQDGVELAKCIAPDLPQPALVLASTAPRTVETAIACGFAVDDIIAYPDVTDETGVAFHAWHEWDDAFIGMRDRMRDSERLSTMADDIIDKWTGHLRSVPDGSCVLAFTHGGMTELALASMTSEARGRAFTHCEGFEVALDAERVVSAKVLRLR